MEKGKKLMRSRPENFRWAVSADDRIELGGDWFESKHLGSALVPMTQEVVSVYRVAGPAQSVASVPTVSIDADIDVEAWTLTIESEIVISLDEVLGESADELIEAETCDQFNPDDIPLENIIRNSCFHYIDVHGVQRIANSIKDADKEGAVVFVLESDSVLAIAKWKKVDGRWMHQNSMNIETARNHIFDLLNCSKAI